MTLESTRRQLLKCLGTGAAGSLLAPVLGQLAANAAGDAAANRPRVVFVMQSNGMNPNHLVPSGVTRKGNSRYGSDTESLVDLSLTGRALHEALQPLAGHQQRLTLIQNLSGRIALSDHSANHGALGCFPANKGPMAQTIDLALAAALPGVFRHVGLGLGESIGTAYSYSAAGPGQATPILCSPELAYKSLFGSVAQDAGQREFDHRTNLLDFLADDVARARSELAGEERHKLDRYLEAFESLRDRQGKIEAMREDIRRGAPQFGAKLQSTTSSVILEAQFELAAAALVTGLTNVVTLTSGEGGQRFGKFPELGIPGLHHIGHGGSFEDKTAEQCFVELRQLHTRLIAGLADRLQSVPEGNGTMLDNTLIVYLSDSGEGHHPSLYQWPVVLLGNLGGRLRAGNRYLDFPKYQVRGHRTMANLYCTLLHAVGQPRDSFGVADPGLKDFDQTGPLAELLS
ncbi:MAG: DUF1552 domain-containing protein [Pirellulaceae bacterium]|nr:DUF1552 domain-containing protein [Pirellulaceae bacterium]